MVSAKPAKRLQLFGDHKLQTTGLFSSTGDRWMSSNLHKNVGIDAFQSQKLKRRKDERRRMVTTGSSSNTDALRGQGLGRHG